MSDPMGDPRVRDNPAAKRYELKIDDQHIAFVEYQMAEGLIIFTHAETPPQFEGRGYGSTLARAVLDDARKRGLKVAPQCPFIAAYMQRHTEYLDLLYR
jgi:predicted GNAT family acetyltransferase